MPPTPVASTIIPPFYAIWIPVIAAVSAAVITGVLSAVVTQNLTMKRFVREREFERRLAWHEKIYRAILNQEAISIKVETHLSTLDVEEFRKANGNWDSKTAEIQDQLITLLRESEVFASLKSHKVCQELLSNILRNDQAANEAIDVIVQDAQDDWELLARASNTAKKHLAEERTYLERARISLCDDMRIGLGIKPLPR